MMSILALDTSTDRSVIALRDRAGGIVQTTHIAGRQHGRELIPQLKALLSRAGIKATELDAIAVGLGPGSYTGSRVGVMAAKTLSYITGAKLVGLNSLHAIARNARPGTLRVSVIADAQRGEVYAVDMIRSGPGGSLTPAAETRIEAVSSWAGRLEAGTIVLGPGLESPRIRSSVPAACLPAGEGMDYPRGEPLIELASEALAAGRDDGPWRLEPLYLRRSAAEDRWDSRQSASPG